jgi:hypothetical protein
MKSDFSGWFDNSEKGDVLANLDTYLYSWLSASLSFVASLEGCLVGLLAGSRRHGLEERRRSKRMRKER